MRRVKRTDSDDTDTAGAKSGYFFSSWSYSDRIILRCVYRRYAFSKVYLMKKIEQSGRGRSCGHWPLWRAMAKAVLSEARRRISPEDLENFFWDVIGRGSDMTTTLDKLLGCPHSPRSSRARRRAVMPKLNVKPVKRSAATTSSDDSDEEEEQKTALRRLVTREKRTKFLPRPTAKDEELPVDLSPRRPQRDEVKVKPFSLDEQGVVAFLDPTTVHGGGDAATQIAVPPESVAGLDNEATSVLDLKLAQISIANDCQPDASATEYAFVGCPEDAGLFGEEPMFSDGSGSYENADATAAVHRIIAGASPEPLPPPVQRVDKGVECDLSVPLYDMMQTKHLLRMELLRAERDFYYRDTMEVPTELQEP